MAGTFELLDGWRATLEAAGVRAITDSRAQFSSPAGYVLIPRPRVAEQGLMCKDGVRLLSGSIWCVCDGPDGTASWQALDALVAIAGPVLGQFLGPVNYSPEFWTLAAMGLDQPAVELTYSDIPCRIYE